MKIEIKTSKLSSQSFSSNSWHLIGAHEETSALIIHSWDSNVLSSLHLILKLMFIFLTDLAWESPDNCYLCFRHLPRALSYVTHVCNIHNICTYMKQHTHTMLPQLLRVTCCCHFDPTSLSLGRKLELYSGCTPTSATFNTHLSLLLPLTHTHIN